LGAIRPGQKSLHDHISTEKKLGVVVHACHSSDVRKSKLEKSLHSRLAWAKRETLSPK
jgi:hypothetical protein